jgi:hypothetical protein
MSLEARIQALESGVKDGGAEAVREAARRYLDREQDPERRRMPEALLAAPDEEINAYIAYRELHDARPGHPDVARDADYFRLLEVLYRRVDCEEAAGWRRLRDLFRGGLLSESYRYGPPSSKHVCMFHIRRDPTAEQMDRLREIWNVRPNTWRRRQALLAQMIQDREQRLAGGAEPITDPEEAATMVQAACEEAEAEAGFSESLDDLEGCVCWNCLRARGEI